MSGVKAPLSTLRLPRNTGQVMNAGVFNAAMQQLELADMKNLKAGTMPNLPGLILYASDNSAWQLTVQPNGTLAVTQVPR